MLDVNPKIGTPFVDAASDVPELEPISGPVLTGPSSGSQERGL